MQLYVNFFGRGHIVLYTLIIALTFTPELIQAQSLLHDEDDKVFEVVEDPPIPWLYKTKCIEADYTEKQNCYLQELGIWLAEELEYPSKALNEKTEGMVFVQFIIDKSGAIRDASILKDIGYGCGDAALNTVNKMPDWIPGRQRGVPVNVRYTLPVKFKLQGK